MTVYIVTILSAAFLSLVIQRNQGSNKTKSVRVLLLILLIVELAVIVGYRNGIGTDFWEYKRMFSVYKDYSWKDLLQVKEPGIRILIKLCAYVSDNYSFYMFICALITTAGPIIIIYKYSKNFTVSIVLYLFLTYLSQCNGMRQSLAMAIIFMGYRHIKENNFWKFLVFPLIASVFHISSIFVIPIYFIYVSKPSLWMAGLILLATLLIRFSYDWLARSVSFFSGEEFESNNYTDQAVNILRIAAMCAPLILTIFLSKKTLQDQSLFFNMILANACVYICMGGSAYFARLGMFTDVFLCMAIPSVVAEYDTRDKEIALLIVLTCYAVFFVFNTMRAGNLVPYQSVLW